MTSTDPLPNDAHGDDTPLRALQLRVGLTRGDLLLPYETIAEVAEAQLATLVSGDQPILGHFTWRGVLLPVIGLDRLMADPPVEWRRRLPVAVVYALNPDERLAYYALALKGVPRSLRLPHRMLEDEQKVEEPLLAFSGKLATDPVVVPDLDALEARVRQMLPVGSEDRPR